MSATRLRAGESWTDRQVRVANGSSLAAIGARRIDWARRQMPVLTVIAERFRREQPLHGLSIAVCLALTSETASLVTAFVAGGATVRLCASNPLATQRDIAAALATCYGVDVHAVAGSDDPDAHARRMLDVLATGPDLIIDDGAHLITLARASHRELAESLIGATEQTTTGVLRLRALEAQDGLRFPVLAVNASPTKHMFDNRYGTGQSALDGIVRATNTLVAGRRVVVIGYGWCGKGIAERAKGAGASVVICEVDPLRALEARMDGYEVMPAAQASATGDLFITATGNRDVIRREHFELMRDGAILCNAGHFDVEINLTDLDRLAVETCEVLPGVTEYRLRDGRHLHVLCRGQVVNLGCGEGSPAAIMDLSFANQALAAEQLVRHQGQLMNGVHVLPEAIDREIAMLKLRDMGVEVDVLTPDQERYAASWEQGWVDVTSIGHAGASA